MADDNDEPDDDTLAAFTKILTKVGPQWLTEQLKATTPPPSEPKQGGSLEAFLQDTLRETRETLKGVTDRMERMRDLLTPEQLIQLRSPATPPSGGGGENGPPNSTPPTAPGGASLRQAQAPDPTPGKTLKRKWL